MQTRFADPKALAAPLHIVDSDGCAAFLASLSEPHQAWARTNNFKAKPGSTLVFPDASGEIALAVIGIGTAEDAKAQRFIGVTAATTLPQGNYKISSAPDNLNMETFALGWLLQSYAFTRYRAKPQEPAYLIAPEGSDAARIHTIAAGETLTRDLINTPSNDMGPDELEAVSHKLAREFGADISVISGDALVEQNFPLIHAVGRASTRAPRLIDMHWGTDGPQLTLVGKGVCFDTGGLNLKPGSSMGLMKKDMGGAAMVLGLARMIMASGLDIRFRVLIPAVENSVSGTAFRPGDVLTARNGLTVEINNTDAEGRLVLADALALAGEGQSDLTLSFATLTGAARVAVGPDLAPFYSTRPAFSDALKAAAERVADPVWEMPFHAPYERTIEPTIADLDNAPAGGFAGSITAALFLKRFAPDPYMHFDVYGWQPQAAPARPKGGVGQATRAVFEALPHMLAIT